MKRAPFIALTWLIAATAACGGPKPQLPSAESDVGPIPVLLELFTSEGCSSCPPADELLSELVSEQPVSGVQIVALGEHVDYWDDLGWPDRFSSRDFTRRQSDYQARVFTDNVVYTPQVVVDGTFEAIGSNERAVRRAIIEAAASPKAKVDVAARLAEPGSVDVTISIEMADALHNGTARVLVAAVESGLETRVERGENRGRTLNHSAVVRALEPEGTIGSDEEALTIAATLPLARDWDIENLRIVAFVQDEGSGRVLGAASAAPMD